jgi:hypothetical protein
VAGWIAGGYAALVVLLGTLGWFTSKRGVPDAFAMAQGVLTLPLSYLVSRTRLSGIAWIIAVDLVGLIQAGIVWSALTAFDV